MLNNKEISAKKLPLTQQVSQYLLESFSSRKPLVLPQDFDKSWEKLVKEHPFDRRRLEELGEAVKGLEEFEEKKGVSGRKPVLPFDMGGLIDPSASRILTALLYYRTNGTRLNNYEEKDAILEELSQAQVHNRSFDTIIDAILSGKLSLVHRPRLYF